MSTNKRKVEPRSATATPEVAAAAVADAHEPHKMTFAENLILTIKVLVGFGLFGALLWAINVWKAAR